MQTLLGHFHLLKTLIKCWILQIKKRYVKYHCPGGLCGFLTGWQSVGNLCMTSCTAAPTINDSSQLQIQHPFSTKFPLFKILYALSFRKLNYIHISYPLPSCTAVTGTTDPFCEPNQLMKTIHSNDLNHLVHVTVLPFRLKWSIGTASLSFVCFLQKL